MSTGTMLFNPFTGTPRHPADIASDPRGVLVWDGEEPLRPAKTQRQPLTDEWFRKTMLELYGIELKEGDYADDILLVRAVEAAHGIKGEA